MKNVFIFLGGAAIGSLITWKYVETKYKKLAEEEIASVKELYKEKLAEKSEFNKQKVEEIKNNYPCGTDEKDIQKKEVEKNNEELEKIINNQKYVTGTDYAEEDKESVQVENMIGERGENNDPIGDIEDDDEDYIVPVEVGPTKPEPPYIITEDEFGEFGNEEQTLIFYSDSVLADEDDDVITDPESVIGDALSEFNDPMTERVFVRDEAQEIDYIILRSEKTYSEVCGEEEQ